LRGADLLDSVADAAKAPDRGIATKSAERMAIV
jgi:hypothetical protein